MSESASFAERPVYDALGAFGKAFSNPVRLRLLDCLQGDPCTVEELAARAGVPVKNTSAQLQQLRAAHLVRARRDGVRMIYSIASPAVGELLAAFETFAETHVAQVRDEVEAFFADTPHLAPVTADELARLGDTVTVIDVRPAAAYARGHIPGAVSVPLRELEQRIGELERGREIVAYCEGPYCLASPRAAARLDAAGLTVHTVLGGYTAWSRAGLPTTS